MTNQQRAVRKAMDYLGIRDHSRHELKTKMRKLEFEDADIDYALDHVEESGWLLSPEALALKVADQLHRKKKSHYYIMAYLQKKKLPAVPRDGNIEREKAQKLVNSRFSRLSNPSQDDKKVMVNYLKNRGFDRETISKVLNDTSGNSKSIYRSL